MLFNVCSYIAKGCSGRKKMPIQSNKKINVEVVFSPFPIESERIDPQGGYTECYEYRRAFLQLSEDKQTDV